MGRTCRSISGGVLTSGDRESFATAWSAGRLELVVILAENLDGRRGNGGVAVWFGEQAKCCSAFGIKPETKRNGVNTAVANGI